MRERFRVKSPVQVTGYSVALLGGTTRASTAVRQRTGPEGDVRRAFYLSYNDSHCEYLTPEEIARRMENGAQIVSATYVTPYPPGYPVLVPGQVFSPQILTFMQSLDTPEVHGYRPDLGYRVYTGKALEIAAPACQPPLPATPRT